MTESSENKGKDARFDCNVRSLNAGLVKRADLNFLCLFARLNASSCFLKKCVVFGALKNV